MGKKRRTAEGEVWQFQQGSPDPRLRTRPVTIGVEGATSELRGYVEVLDRLRLPDGRVVAYTSRGQREH